MKARTIALETPQEQGTSKPQEPQQHEKPARSRAAYQAERRKHSVSLAFRDVDEKERFEGMAGAAGYRSFNAYLLQMLHNATSGAIYPPEYVEGLRREVEKLRGWMDQAREEGAELRKDVKLLQAEKETLILLLHELPGGAEAAANHLQQQKARALGQAGVRA